MNFFNSCLQTYQMNEQAGEGRKQPSKRQKIYSFCKNLIALFITLVALIPVIYLLGSDDSIYPSRPLFSAYADQPYFQAKLAEVQSALNSSQVVNLHAGEKKDGSVRQWQHLQEFVRYLGNHLNSHQITTVNRFVVPPEIKQSKKGKSSSSADNQKLIEKAYSLANSGELNAVKNKLNKIAQATISRLKIKQRQAKNQGIGQTIRYRVVDAVLSAKVWIITIHPDSWQYHSPEELKKQINALVKQREKDRFVVVSLSPAAPEWKKMTSIAIAVNESIFSTLKEKINQIVKVSLPFEVNATRLIETVLCHYQTSLYQLNNFLHSCNNTFSCHNSIRLLAKKPKKDDSSLSLLNQLCANGHIDEQDDEFKTVLNDLGFFNEQEQAEESIKLYYEIANGKKCKGSKKCSFEWLKGQSFSEPIKISIKTEEGPKVEVNISDTSQSSGKIKTKVNKIVKQKQQDIAQNQSQQGKQETQKLNETKNKTENTTKAVKSPKSKLFDKLKQAKQSRKVTQTKSASAKDDKSEDLKPDQKKEKEANSPKIKKKKVRQEIVQEVKTKKKDKGTISVVKDIIVPQIQQQKQAPVIEEVDFSLNEALSKNQSGEPSQDTQQQAEIVQQNEAKSDAIAVVPQESFQSCRKQGQNDCQSAHVQVNQNEDIPQSSQETQQSDQKQELIDDEKEDVNTEQKNQQQKLILTESKSSEGGQAANQLINQETSQQEIAEQEQVIQNKDQKIEQATVELTKDDQEQEIGGVAEPEQN